MPTAMAVVAAVPAVPAEAWGNINAHTMEVNMCCCQKYNAKLCRYALGAPIVGTTQVVYSIRTTLCKLRKQDLFMIFVPASTTSTLPPVLQLCDGSLLPVVFSGTADPAQAGGLIGGRAHLATIICNDGVATLNVFDAQNPAGA